MTDEEISVRIRRTLELGAKVEFVSDRELNVFQVEAHYERVAVRAEADVV